MGESFLSYMLLEIRCGSIKGNHVVYVVEKQSWFTSVMYLFIYLLRQYVNKL